MFGIYLFLSLPCLIDIFLMLCVYIAFKRWGRNEILLILTFTLGAILCLPVAIGATYLAATSGYSAISNDAESERFSQPFFDYPLPPQTTELSRSATVSANLAISQDNCVFTAKRIFRTALSYEELEEYYEKPAFFPLEQDSYLARAFGKDGKLKVWIEYDKPAPQQVTIYIQDRYEDSFRTRDLRCMGGSAW